MLPDVTYRFAGRAVLNAAAVFHGAVVRDVLPAGRGAGRAGAGWQRDGSGPDQDRLRDQVCHLRDRGAAADLHPAGVPAGAGPAEHPGPGPRKPGSAEATAALTGDHIVTSAIKAGHGLPLTIYPDVSDNASVQRHHNESLRALAPAARCVSAEPVNGFGVPDSAC
jgi:hypothetical protein